MNEVMMVPVEEFNRLQDYYKGKITESALLNKAGRLAAEQHLVLNDKRIPDSMAVKIVKPMATEQGRLVKRLRTGTAGPTAYKSTEEPEGMVDSPVENMLKKMIKGLDDIKKEPTVAAADAATPSTSGIKKEKRGPKLTIPSKPFISTKKKRPATVPKKKKKEPSFKKTVLSAGTKSLLKSIGVDYDDEGGYSPKGAKGKKPKKAKKTEVQKLQEGWEEFTKPSRRRLDYDTDSD